MNTCQEQDINCYVRWLIRRDMKEVLEIENYSFDDPWSEEDFIKSLRQRNCIGMVAEFNERVIGYMIYELHKTKLHILNFGVDFYYRRNGVGTTMVNKLKSKLSYKTRTTLDLFIQEENLYGQLFFRKNGFIADHIDYDIFYNNPAYHMKYTLNTGTEV